MKRIHILIWLQAQLMLSYGVAAQAWQETVVVTPQASGVDASFRGLAVQSEAEAWVTGTGGTVIRTTDAGRSWKKVAVPDSDRLDFRDVEILPDGTVILMSIGSGAASRVLRSPGFGKTWDALSSVQMLHKACVRSLGNGRMLTCGRTGVAFSQDAGLTWEQITTDSYYTLAINQDSESGFLAGSDGRVARVQFLPARKGLPPSGQRTPESTQSRP